jgi:hypothetical protein
LSAAELAIVQATSELILGIMQYTLYSGLAAKTRHLGFGYIFINSSILGLET